MIINIIGTLFADFLPALNPFSPSYAPASSREAGVTSPKRRRRSGRFVSLLTTLSFILCLTTFSANAATKEQLGTEIKRAEDLLNTTAISPNGWEIPIGMAWASQETNDYLANMIESANAIYNGTTQPDYDYNDYLIELSNARKMFENVLNPSGLKYDYTNLENAIAAAEAAISPAKFAVSDNGMNVPGPGPGSKKWTSQNNLDAFKLLITAARNVITQYGEHGQSVSAAETNQAAINAAATSLNGNASSFKLSLSDGYMPNYSALTTAIAAAQDLLLTTAISVDGTDVPTATNWTTLSVRTALNNAVTAAQDFVNTNAGAIGTDLSTNQNEVTDEVNTLNTAMGTFNDNADEGTGSLYLYKYLELNAAIADAQAALASIESDAMGNNVSPDESWATPNYWDALKDLVSAEIQTYGNAANDGTIWATNQALIDNAAAALRTATTNLRTNAKNGCKPDYSQLTELIGDAQKMLEDTPESVDGHEYAFEKSWALSADRDTLQNEIDTAQRHAVDNDLAIYGDWNANQNAVDAARSDLSDAYNTFLTQCKPGDKCDPASPNYTGLPTEIQKAEALLDSDDDGTEDVVPSTSQGKDVAYGTKWLTSTEYNFLTTHLTNARAIVDSHSSYTQTHTDNTYTALSSAVVTFTPQEGLGANPSVLTDEIEAAELLKADLDGGVVAKSSSIGTDVVYGTSWVSQTVANNLTIALTNANNASSYAPPTTLHSAIRTLESALRSAINAFVPAFNTPAYAAPDTAVLYAGCDSIFNIVDTLAASAHSGGDVETDAMWVPLADKNALLDTIASKRSATYSTHEEVLIAISDLDDALTALQASQSPGNKSAYILAKPQDIPNGFVGALYNVQVVDAALPSVAFVISSGALPNGLSLDASATGTPAAGTGKLTGKPTTPGTFDFTIQAAHSSIPVTETLPHSIKIYDAPAIVPTEYDYQETDRLSISSDIIIRFPSGVPMDTTVFGTITVNRQSSRAYWVTDTTLIIPCPMEYYEYETAYTLVVAGLVSKDNLLAYDCTYDFHTRSIPPNPDIPRSVTLLPLSDGVASDPLPGQYWIGSYDGYNFKLKLTVPPDMVPTLTTNRIINGKTETVTGVPDPDMPGTGFLFTILQIHQAIEINVTLLPVGNEVVDDGVRIWASGGKLYIETPQPGLLSVYSITGILHARKTVAGSSAISLPKGVYIVRLDGKTCKVAVL
jgi:hypothetical protein